MENININEIYKKIKRYAGDEYFSFKVEIDHKGCVSFRTYLSPEGLMSGESFKASTPEDLYRDIEHAIEQQKRKDRNVNEFNISLCGHN